MVNAGDVAAFGMNVATAICIIFVNKLLMGRNGYAFGFAVTLSGMHYLSAASFLTVYKSLGFMDVKAGRKMPMKEMCIFVLVSCVSIVSLNGSLMLNSVGFYQMCKLAIAPFVCLVEFLYLGKTFTLPVLGSIAVVLSGVGIVTLYEVSDISTTFLGLNLGAMSIMGAGLQQVLCGSLQKSLNMTSLELLLESAWPQGAVLFIAGPFLDYALTGRWVTDYPYSFWMICVTAVSCTFAILVNLSQFVCLGRFSALAYSVMGHSKTVLVLLGGWFIFGEYISSVKGAGMVVAVSGMMLYGYYSKKAAAAAAAAAPPPPPKDLEGARTLEKTPLIQQSPAKQAS